MDGYSIWDGRKEEKYDDDDDDVGGRMERERIHI